MLKSDKLTLSKGELQALKLQIRAELNKFRPRIDNIPSQRIPP